ncbi:hypothetical protein BGX23_010839 [Mortierella sp. AD031]|nr:hypothetical protein BGX23_010839 [Mortierella sp. AD031]
MSRLLFTRTAAQSTLRRYLPKVSIPPTHSSTTATLHTPLSLSSCSHRNNTFHTSTTSHYQSAHIHNPKSNHYERLGLPQDATKKEIKTKFYKLSKLHHPDKNASESSRLEFLSINEAYSTLADDRRRRDYDLTLRDKTGSLYSNSSSYTTSHSQSGRPLRGSLRRTPFRHSAQSAAAAAAARNHAAYRSTTFGMGGVGVGGGTGSGGGGGGGPVPHFDSKSHREMHYEQEIRQEERRQARERASAEAKWRQSYEESDGATGKIFRVAFVFLSILLATSFMRVFADENGDEQGQQEQKEREQEQKQERDYHWRRKRSYCRPSLLLSQLDHVRTHHNDSSSDNRIALDPSFYCDLG